MNAVTEAGSWRRARDPSMTNDFTHTHLQTNSSTEWVSERVSAGNSWAGGKRGRKAWCCGARAPSPRPAKTFQRSSSSRCLGNQTELDGWHLWPLSQLPLFTFVTFGGRKPHCVVASIPSPLNRLARGLSAFTSLRLIVAVKQMLGNATERRGGGVGPRRGGGGRGWPCRRREGGGHESQSPSLPCEPIKTDGCRTKS